MKSTCEERIGSTWNRYPCGKPAVEEIEGDSLCTVHAKKIKIRRGLDTGETLVDRYVIIQLSLFKVSGIVGKKVFIVRKSAKLFTGEKYTSFCDKQISLDSPLLFEDFGLAKVAFSAKLQMKVIELREQVNSLQMIIDAL